jgi:hypothetical protein
MILGAAVFALAGKAGVGFVCSKCGNPVKASAAGCASCGAVFDEA